jgi:hypothetical protein
MAYALDSKSSTERFVGSSPTLATMLGRNYKETPTAIFLCGAIGDVIAIECYLSDAARASLEAVCLPDSDYGFIPSLFGSIPNYPKLTRYIEVCPGHNRQWHNKAMLLERMVVEGFRPKDADGTVRLIEAQDWSLDQVFAEYNEGTALKYNGSSFARHTLAQNPVAGTYYAVCPYAGIDVSGCNGGRNFDADDWEATLKHLDDVDLSGVVVGKGDGWVPEHPRLLNMMNKTTLNEALEVVKNATGYIGVDSSMSVMASKTVKQDNFHLKTVNVVHHARPELMRFYFAPYESGGYYGKTVAAALGR